MKRTVWVVGLVVLVGLVAGCAGGGASVKPLALNAAPWQDGERLVYDIVGKSGNVLGASTFSFAKEGEAWLLTASDKAGQLDQTSQVRVDAATLAPLGKEKTIKSAGTDATLSITYGGGKVQIKATVNGKNQNVSVAIPAGVVENDQLLMTLRALPFAEGYQGKTVVVVPDTASKVNTIVRVKGQETVETPAGSFKAWRVELDFGQAKQSAWYEVSAPYRMVQYDNGTTKMVLSKS